MVDFESEGYKRSLGLRVALNSAILVNKYWYCPVDNEGHESFVPVGRNVKATSPFCGQPRGVSVCKNVAGHAGLHLDGVDCTGKVVVRHNHIWCSDPKCPVCFARGHSSRLARSIGGRLAEAEKRGLGKPEHVTVSVAVADRDLSESVMRLKCREALFDRGVVGGMMIFHGYRIDRNRGVLVWSPHYHSLSMIGNGGFERCRGCVHNRESCALCDGFKGREVRGYAKDGYLVKVHEARKTVVGTLYYQLNHSTVHVGIKRFHCVTWFGTCGNRMFKGVKLKAESLCAVCGEKMVKCFHVGKRRLVKDIGSPDYVPVFVDDEFDLDGSPNYVDRSGGKLSDG
jgi:hypothetical protein